MKRLITFIVALAVYTQARAVPVISTTAGTIGTDNVLQINGSGFGTKSRSKLLVWADAQNGTLQPLGSLSFLGSWNPITIANTTTSPRWGTRTFVSTFDGTSVTSNQTKFQVNMPSIGYGSYLYAGFWRKADFAFTGNWKPWRMWTPGGAKNFPNTYLGDLDAENTASRIVATEDDLFTTGINRLNCASYTFPNATWRFEEFIVHLNSGVGVADGLIRVRINGQTVCEDTTYRFNSTAYPQINYTDFQIQDQANTKIGADKHIWKDSIAVDDSLNRILIGNASTFATCTHFEYQPYTAWNSVQVTVNQKLGTLTGNKYLYVCDTNDQCTPNGFFLSSGGDPTPPTPAPDVTSISPSSGSALGGTTFNITGIDFLPGPTVTVGGVPATGVIFNSATSITAVTPAGIGSAIVIVTNTDSQSDAFNYFNYDTPPVVAPSTARVFPWVHP